jgi:hypothetical protein
MMLAWDFHLVDILQFLDLSLLRSEMRGLMKEYS